jgi:pilus assembly protein CpaB
MSSTALKVLALVALALAVGLGLMAYRMSQDIAKPSPVAQPDGGPAPAQTMAMVAIKPLVAYQAVAADAVALVPVAVLPAEYYSKPEEVVGKAPLADVPTGTTLGPRYFREANTLVRSIPSGFQAMSLEINDVIAVGGFVRPGDLVDVLLYIRASGREVEDSQARILLREARVLAYEDRILNDAELSDAGTGGATPAQQRARRIRTAVLAVPETDTTRVMLGASLGELRLALRGALPEAVDEAADEAPAPGELLATPAATPPVAAPAASEQVITLRELAEIKQKKQGPAAQAQDAPPIVIYRGSDVKHVAR